jgi:hypothetical protein
MAVYYKNKPQGGCRLLELWKMDHRLVAVGAINKMASVGISRNGCATIGISQLSQCNMLRDKFELEAES